MLKLKSIDTIGVGRLSEALDKPRLNVSVAQKTSSFTSS